jgi:hypothetical protein
LAICWVCFWVSCILGYGDYFVFFRSYSGAYRFSSRLTSFFYGMYVFSWHLSGFIFRVRGSVGQIVGFSAFLLSSLLFFLSSLSTLPRVYIWFGHTTRWLFLP